MKTPKSQMMDRLVRISSTGVRTGSVTSLKTRHERAPSISRRLDELTRHLRERGVDGDRDERKPGPDDQRRHHAYCESVVVYQLCWKKLPKWSSVST